MIRSKQRVAQHLTDEEGQQLLRNSLPRQWVLREYRPDYGIDFAVEVFGSAGTDKRGKPKLETLGEHIFIQLKSTKKPKRKSLTLYPRGNVEKSPEKLDRKDPPTQVEVIECSIETSELITIQRMGAALPVLLVVADLSAKRCYFVCLNDYIDKILIPKYEDYANMSSRTIQIPTSNVVGRTGIGLFALRWYAKRAKLYAAFQKFHYQSVELKYAFYRPEFEQLANYFARTILRYEFWDDAEMWAPISQYGSAVQRLLETGSPGMWRQSGVDSIPANEKEDTTEELKDDRRMDVVLLWDKLSTLPRNYEELQREWFLPTALSTLMSYP